MRKSSLVKIEDPINGAIFHSLQGEKVNDGLAITIAGTSLTKESVYVNGQGASVTENTFSAKVILQDQETDIVVNSGNEKDVVRLIWDRDESLRYSLSLDDNSFFLEDIFKNNYPSLFDNFYLKGLRDLHTKYGAKFTLNCFYKVDDRYLGTFGPFSLKQFSPKYKGEWEDNSHWLKLAFHAFSEFPNRPYQQASLEKITEDFDLVKGEIIRFAGNAYVPTSTTHWAMQPEDSFKILAERGVKVLCGFFAPLAKKDPATNLSYDINYCLDDAISRYLHEHKAVKDFKSGIVFCPLDLLFNATEIDKIPVKLETVMQDPKKRGVLVLLTHEQYFWPQYKASSSWFTDDSSGVVEFKHVSDHFERLETGIRKVTENGYKPVFLYDCYDL